MRSETTSIRELAEMHRMGHTCANLNGDLFFVWGGSNENLAYISTKNTHLWIYETLTGYWRHRTCSGECPPYLSGASSALIGQRMFVFGGHSTTMDNWLNSLYCLDLETFVWRDLGAHAKAEPTKPIRSDKCVSWSFGGRLYVFGGYGWSQTEHLCELLDIQKDLQLAPDYRWPKFGWNNQLVEFDPGDYTWRWPSYSGKCPSARAAHSGALMGSTFYLFGGRDSRERLNDLYTFDMKTFTWNQISIFATATNASPHLSRPIRHLLESDDEGYEIQAAAAVRDNVAGDDSDYSDAVTGVGYQAMRQQQFVGEEMEVGGVDEPTPSPSSTVLYYQNLQSSLTDHDNTSFEVDSDDDNDDEPNYLFEYPHPSHLLERWSLSSHQSASSSSHLSDNIDCQQAPTTNQIQTSMMASQPSSYGYCDQPSEPIELGHNLIEENQQQQQQLVAQQDTIDQPSHQPTASSSIMPAAASVPPVAAAQAQPMPPAAASIELSTDGETPMPVGRSFSSFTPISEHQILLFGGISSQDENLGDCWVFDTKFNLWNRIDLKNAHPRLWHTGARTNNNEVVIIGGSCSDKIDEFCTDVMTVSLEPKSLKRLALDTVAKSIRMRSVNKVKDLPSTVCKLVKLRKQALALSLRRLHHRPRGTQQN